MEDSFIHERYDGLVKDVKRALENMKQDGLSLILQKHPTSVEFASQRLNEVLIEALSRGREAAIQKLTEDIYEANRRHNKIQNKLFRCQELTKQAMSKVTTENENCKIEMSALNQSILEIQNDLKKEGKEEKDLLQSKNEKVSKIYLNLRVLNDQVNHLQQDVRSMRKLFVSTNANCMKDLNHSHTVLLDAAYKMSIDADDADFNDVFGNEISLKREIANEIQIKNNVMKASLGVLQDFINKQAEKANIKDSVDFLSNNPNFEHVLWKVIDSNEENAIQQHFEKSKSRIPDEINLSPDGFTQSVSDLYRRKLLEMEKKYDKAIQEAKMRNKTLTQTLNNAMNQLKELQVVNDSFDVFKEIRKNSSTVETSKLALDEAFSKLGLSNLN